MPTATIPVDHAAIALAARLSQAWNAADGAAFAAPFTEDADFVDIRGEHAVGREAIAQGHQGIFDTIYAGSMVAYMVRSVRTVAPGTAVAIIDATLEAPIGPMAGTNRACATIVLTEEDGDWVVASFHNTLRSASDPRWSS